MKSPKHTLKRALSLSLAPCALAMGLAGCTDLASGDYDGEPLVTVHGVVTNPQALTFDATADTKAYLLWSASDAVVRAAEVDVAPTFPASFSIDVFQPPPEQAFLDDGAGHSMAMGIVAFMTDAQLATYTEYWAAQRAGTAADFDRTRLGTVGVATSLIYYFSDEESAAVLTAGVAGIEPHVGFNFLTLEEAQCPDTSTEDETDTIECTQQVFVDESYEFDLQLSVNDTVTVE
jgi:hypothetical protein